MNILIFGGTGFIGSRLAETLQGGGHNLFTASRQVSPQKNPGLTYIKISEGQSIELPEGLTELYAVINLASENIAAKRWSGRQKEKILNSRLAVLEQIRELTSRIKPTVFINASAVGYYGNCGDNVVNEDSPPGSDFLANVCRKIEAVANNVNADRVINLRIGVVLGKGGGALQKMLLPFKLGLGGRLGSGRQWMSWIHIDDVVGIINHCLKNESLIGVVNAVVPNPLRNSKFTGILAKALKRPAIFPVQSFMLKLLFGEMSTVLLTGQKVNPLRVLESAYKFKYANLETALNEILN